MKYTWGGTVLANPEEEYRIGLKYFKEGDMEEAEYHLFCASLLLFAIGEYEKCIKAGELAAEAARKLGYYDVIYEREYFPKIARLMLQQKPLPEDAVRGFYKATATWEEKDPDYEYVVMAAKRIAEYMKKMGQDPGELEYLIEVGEFLIEQRKKFDPSKDKIMLTYKNLKLGYLAGFFLGKFDVSKLKPLPFLDRMEINGICIGHVEFEGLMIDIRCNDEGGGFQSAGN